MKEHHGGCRCGQVRYKARKENLRTAVCGCIDCQKAGGAPLAVNVGFEEANFEITEGENFLKSYADIGESGKAVHRYFCINCGSPLYGKPEGYAGYISVRTMSLDKPFLESPKFVIFHENIPNWIHLPHEAIAEGKKLSE